MRQHDFTSRNLGFTLLELIIAISISVVVIFFISSLFNSTGSAVSRGVNLTAIAARADAASRTLSADFEEEVFFGPADDGVLMIMHYAYENVPLHGRGPGDGGEIRRQVRSDQLVFFRSGGTGRNRIRPVVPTNADTFEAPSFDSPARIWYGHLHKTHPVYGVLAMNNSSAKFDVGDLGKPGSGNAGDINLWGDEWTLGRQALFLKHDAGVDGVAESAYHNARVSSVGVASDLPSWFPASTNLHMGLADVANIDHRGTVTTHPVEGTALINSGEDVKYVGFDLGSHLLDEDEFAYRGIAYLLAYPVNRLWANAVIPSTSQFESWRIAQGHPIFLSNVSDFTVDFAADIVNNVTGEIDGPDGGPDGRVDVIIDGEGIEQIKWYTSTSLEKGTPKEIKFTNTPGDDDYDENLPDTYPVPPGWTPQDPSPSPWPPLAMGAFVWRHDSDDWPYLLRIRYRLHDTRGEVGEETGKPGLWFEDILMVDRQ